MAKRKYQVQLVLTLDADYTPAQVADMIKDVTMSAIFDDSHVKTKKVKVKEIVTVTTLHA